MARIRSSAAQAVLAVALGAVVIGCGSSVATSSPTLPPPPTPTPDPHLSPPVSVDLLYNKLKKAGLTIYVNTADAGRDGEPIKRLNLSYEGWPLLIAEYSSARALARETGFEPGKRPGEGDPPYTVAGLDILVQYGPTVVNRPPAAPDARWADAAAKLAALLDPWLGPLQQSSVVPLPLATPIPAPTVAPTPTTAPTPTPTKKPKPTKKP